MDIINFFTVQPHGREWTQVIDILLAFALASLIGLEREWKMKNAGLRTHALVGLSAALLMLVSKYGFNDVLVGEHLRFDPGRVAAQIVSGIGFIGGGIIFVRKDIVHGVTTAATIWLTAAIGMACGASLYLLAIIVCGGYFIVVFGYTGIVNRVHGRTTHLHICYRPGYDAAAATLALCSSKGFTVLGVTMDQHNQNLEVVSMEMRVHGKIAVDSLIRGIAALPAIISVDRNTTGD